MSACHFDTHDSLPVLARAVLDCVREPILARFLADWPAAEPTQAPARGAAGAGPLLPVLRFLPRIAADRASFGAAFVGALCRTAPRLAWRQSYTEREVGAAFLENYAWSELLRSASSGTGARISCGVVVLGPDTLYPPHRHEAEEIYLPLSGRAAWLKGDALWRERSPGTLIHHLSEEPHAMRTRDEPLLAMYLWRSSNLQQKARLDLEANT
jgi:Dimethlysulfonioproprionate lyase